MPRRKHNTGAWWKFTIERLNGVINRTGIRDSKILSKAEFLDATIATKATSDLIALGLRKDGWTVHVTNTAGAFHLTAKRRRIYKGVNTMITRRSHGGK